MATTGPAPVPKQFVLCFDGTGNKFSGDESDSNVLKIFRMLDRSKAHQFHYYQPGIGTYVTSTSLSSSKGTIVRIRHAYLKAKDQAIGSSFADHVLGGYKFLMRYYSPGDDIYFIGFSRGAYVARFLAEMLDFVGLLEAGNEELIRFAWKTFAKWQQRRGGREEDSKKKKELFHFMKAFRETFSRPITRIRFLGLFDTVNSVPAFESAWMQRSKFPYTARSSARVIRHAVSIDERRAKFRQDLISEQKPWHETAGDHHWHLDHFHAPHLHLHHEGAEHPHDHDNDHDHDKPEELPTIVVNDNDATAPATSGSAQPPAVAREQGPGEESAYRRPRTPHSGGGAQNESRYRVLSPRRKLNLAVPVMTASTEDLTSLRSGHSGDLSLQVPSTAMAEYDDDDDAPQDIQEVWFPGGHADIGGGWKLEDGERWALSHGPLVWMVQEAQRAGLESDPDKMKQFHCCEDDPVNEDPIRETRERSSHEAAPRETFLSPQAQEGQAAGSSSDKAPASDAGGRAEQPANRSSIFRRALHFGSVQGILHDSLEFGGGLEPFAVLSWKMMEYLPFRRMDLQDDGSWRPIRWPLPCGEVRDIPLGAQIHVSAIRRLQEDPNYRPGNLILGGGGRGVRRAPKEYGIGEWVVASHDGDPVRETYVRKSVTKRCQDDHQ